jgi:hypothetical protein
MVGLAPAIKQQGDYFRADQQRTAFVHAHSDVLENGLIRKFQRNQMWKPVTTRFAG